MTKTGNMGDFAKAEQAAYDAFPVTVRCALCPEWIFQGTAAEGRTAALAHRKELHPKLTRKRRAKRHLGNWRQTLPAKEQREIAEEERTRRMFLLGISPEDAI